MSVSAKSFLSGALSGVLVSYSLIYSIAVTAAIAMPRDFPVSLWDASVIFGLGAFLPTLILYSLSLLISRSSLLISLVGFLIAVIVGLSVFAELTYAGSALSATVLGALAATALVSLRPNNSFKPSPHQGGA